MNNPYPHFYLQSALDRNNKLVFETISCTFVKSPQVDIRFVLALNNSKLFAWLLYKLIYSNAIRSTRYDEMYVGRIPTPDLEEVDQVPCIELVERILSITQDKDYFGAPEKAHEVEEIMCQIDQMVYKLYGLTDEEIAIVEGRNER